MGIAVGFGCLVAIAITAGVTGLPEQHLRHEDQIADFEEGPLERQNGFTKRECKIVGGLCLEEEDCVGEFRPNNFYCRGSGLGCCIPRGCLLNFKTYQNGEYNDDTSLVMQCDNGEWVFTGKIMDDGGECKVEGDPHFIMFDYTSFLGYPANMYEFGGNGSFVITQNGLSSPSYGVIGSFDTCNTADEGLGVTCINSISYYEPGITVDLVLPYQNPETYPDCTKPGADPNDDPNCRIKVFVNGDEVAITNGSATILQATNGNVLIFNADHIETNRSLVCKSVVGSQGLSVSLCEHFENFPYLYVWAVPELRHEPSQLFGLCNTYTGITQDNFTMSDGSGTQDIVSFGDSWGANKE